MTDEEISMALRRRIQSQSLVHRVGHNVAGHVVKRFRKAGTWQGEISQPIQQSLLPVLTQADHPLRMPLPTGPLVVLCEGKSRFIIEVSEQLLSCDVRIRQVALQHFRAAASEDNCWVSAYVLELLRKNSAALSSDDESTWIGAGLLILDAIEHDFRVNCAGVKQSTQLGSQLQYAEYLNKVLRPRAKCFEHDRPTILTAAGESELIRAKVREWSALDSLGGVLDKYLDFCGYLPLSGDLSAGSLISAWKDRHPDQDVWKSLWQWTESCPSVLAKYHVAQALLEKPNWILVEDVERLLETVRNVISSAETDASCANASLWQLHSHLVQHFQIHLEASVPGLRSDIAATMACWMTAMVAPLFQTDRDQIRQDCEVLQEETLPLSWRRWWIARSPMASDPLRVANLHTSFIWSDSLLATAVRRFNEIPEFDGRATLQEFLVRHLTRAVCVGGLRATGGTDTIYAFEQPVSSSDLWLSDAPTNHEKAETARHVISAKTAIESPDSLKQLLLDLKETPDGLSEFLCVNLHSRPPGHKDEEDQVIRETIMDDDWRKATFQRLRLPALENLLSFLIHWQMQQDEEWIVRVPHIFAHECEKATDTERLEFLLFMTAFSAMAGDIASPIVRLLAGQKRGEVAPMISAWCEKTRQIAIDSEPWLAARVRGFLGTIENVM